MASPWIKDETASGKPREWTSCVVFLLLFSNPTPLISACILSCLQYPSGGISKSQLGLSKILLLLLLLAVNLVSTLTVDGEYNHEIKGHLLFGRKAMTNLDRVLKSRDITLPTTAHTVKAMVFPVVMYRFVNWTIKKAEL